MLGTRQISRKELDSPQSSRPSSPDPTLEQLFQSRISSQYTFEIAETDGIDANHVDHSDDDGIELRLFAGPSNAAPQTQKIRLESPGLDSGNPGFKVKKPRSYYFADAPTQEEQAALTAAAVDGKAVLQLAQQPWPGCTLPWKVRIISATGLKKQVLIAHPRQLLTVEEKIHKRTRKSKKTRIALRKRAQASKTKQEEKAKVALEKEEAEREKRTRRNREKKLKKKAKKASNDASQAPASETAAEVITEPTG